MDASLAPLSQRASEAKTPLSPSRSPIPQRHSVPLHPREVTDPPAASSSEANSSATVEVESTGGGRGGDERRKDPSSESSRASDGARSAASTAGVRNGPRSASSPQLASKAPTRSKVYRKTSLKSSSENSARCAASSRDASGGVSRAQSRTIVHISSRSESFDERAKRGAIEGNDRASETRSKSNAERVHITCNPLSTPYPYSTPRRKGERAPIADAQEDEPKGHSCGSFLPIFSLIPQSVVSFQYLSPKMKFSWWRNKIS